MNTVYTTRHLAMFESTDYSLAGDIAVHTRRMVAQMRSCYAIDAYHLAGDITMLVAPIEV
jgi:hypothetical protein